MREELRPKCQAYFEDQQEVVSGTRDIVACFCGEDENEEVCRTEHIAMLVALSIREGVERGCLMRCDGHDNATEILHAIARRLG